VTLLDCKQPIGFSFLRFVVVYVAKKNSRSDPFLLGIWTDGAKYKKAILYDKILHFARTTMQQNMAWQL
jgi:hypothetical protein